MLTISAFPVHSQVDGDTSPDEVALRIGFQEGIDSLNPLVGLTKASKSFHSLLYSCLFRVNEYNEITGDLAKDWRVDTDFAPFGSVWRYNLTKNARWHDGTRLTADDVVHTLNLMAGNQSMMWTHQPYVMYIDFAEKVDDYALRIHFYDRASETPLPVSFGNALFIPIFPKHIIENMNAAEVSFDFTGVTEGLSPPLVGSGPFMATDDIMEEWLSGDEITLVRNPEFHGLSDWDCKIGIEKLEILENLKPTELAEAVVNGTLDLAWFDATYSSPWRRMLEENVSEQLEISDIPSCAQHMKVLDFDFRANIGNAIRLDPSVRQAMAMAIDRTEIVSCPEMLNEYAKEGTTMISSADSVWHWEPTENEMLNFDIDQANALLEAAGYRYTPESPDVRVATADSWAVQEGLAEEGTNLTFQVVYGRSQPEDKAIVEYLENEWGKIGIDVEPEVYTYGRLCPVFWFFEIMVYDFWGHPPDPHMSLFAQSTAAWGGWNDNFYDSPDYNEHYNESITALNPEVRREHVHECQRIQYTDVSYIVLAEMENVFALRTDSFQGWSDWSECPGGSIENYWGAGALFFGLGSTQDSSTASLVGVAALGIAALMIVGVVAFVFNRKK